MTTATNGGTHLVSLCDVILPGQIRTEVKSDGVKHRARRCIAGPRECALAAETCEIELEGVDYEMAVKRIICSHDEREDGQGACAEEQATEDHWVTVKVGLARGLYM